MDNLSIIQQAVQTPHDEALLMSMMEEENISADELLYNWELFARPSQLTPKKDWLYWLICSGRGFGKLLSLDTTVPTIDGWTTIGNIQVGDKVFDENGKVCNVIELHPIFFNKKCFELTFSDGTKITTDENHEWFTWDKAARKAYKRSKNPTIHPQTRTTIEIKKSLYAERKDGGIEINHSIKNTGPLQLEDKPLLIHPYLLGVWLSDGSSNDGSIYKDDQFIWQKIKDIGYTLKKRKPYPNRCECNSVVELTTTILKQLGVYKNKHIPTMYLRASYRQRMELMQGLIDGDGAISDRGHCEFCSVFPKLANNFYELCMTLGIKATKNKSRAYSYNDGIKKRCKDRYRIHFTSYLPICSTPHKKERLHKEGKQAERQKQRFIVSIKRVFSVPVRCIKVDSESHLFLVSKSFIPTHNTRAAAEWIRNQVENHGKRHVALVGATAADVRDTMVMGVSGILSVSPPWNRPEYIPSKRCLIWPNGAMATTYSAEKPDRLRGPAHDVAWCDELATWQRMQDTWDMLMFGLRIGDKPQCVVSTTPRPVKLIKELIKDKNTVLTGGDTFENRANLSQVFFDRIIQKYKGTRLGRQEIYAEILDDNPEALFDRDIIDKYRVNVAPQLVAVSVGVDPAVTSNENSDDTGIIVAGKSKDNHFYILADLTCHKSPDKWARVAVNAYNDYLANKIVAETNNGGDMVKILMKAVDPTVRVKTVTATRGKALRAEPISSLYEQGRVHHVGIFPKLEDQQTQWDPSLGEISPDRLDGLVWALTDLSKTAGGKVQAY